MIVQRGEITRTFMGTEFKILVEYTYHEGSCGAREGGVPVEPDEPESVEIHNIYLDADGSGQWIDLYPDDDEIEELREEILEKHA